MSIDHSGPGRYCVRAVLPDGTRVEADLPYLSDGAAAARKANMLAFYLSPGGPDELLGPVEVAADLRDTVGALGFDPADCAVEVAERDAGGPNGWRPVWGQPVWPAGARGQAVPA